MISRASGVLAAGMLSLPMGLIAQGYRLDVRTGIQSVAYRGSALDSVARDEVVADAAGSLTTADGFAVRCVEGAPHCFYFRPGPVNRSGPWVTSVNGSMWGLGVPGVRAHVGLRLLQDLGRGEPWPGTEPTVQLLEGYLEYATERFTVRGGRTHTVNRLGWTGIDGGWAEVRLPRRVGRVEVYAGWGLARGIALPVTSPVLNPLDDFQPRGRQLVFGGAASFRQGPVLARFMYQRDIDPGPNYFVAERVGGEMSARLPLSFIFAAGVDYDMASGWWGSGEARLTFAPATGFASAGIGVRRYRPHFDLWTIWGAFSPVPYHARFGFVQARPHDRLQLLARGEWYAFADAEATSPLLTAEQDGWRGSTTARVAVTPWIDAELGTQIEFGPGAASLGYRAGVEMRPDDRIRVSASASRLDRPLEFRFSDARVWSYGVSAWAEPHDRLRVTVDAWVFDETRRRPDAAQFDWDQLRLRIGLSAFLSSSITPRGLPPAVLRIPPRRVR